MHMIKKRDVKLEEISSCVSTAVEIYFPEAVNETNVFLSDFESWEKKRPKFEKKLVFFLKDEIGVVIDCDNLREITDWAYTEKSISEAIFFGLYPERKKLWHKVESEVINFIETKENAAYGGLIERMNFFNEYFSFREGLDRSAAHKKFLQMESDNKVMKTLVADCYRAEITKNLEEEYEVCLKGLELIWAWQFADAVIQKKFDN